MPEGEFPRRRLAIDYTVAIVVLAIAPVSLGNPLALRRVHLAVGVVAVAACSSVREAAGGRHAVAETVSVGVEAGREEGTR
jgi:hypothetical protein